MNLSALPAGAPFLDSIAAHWLEARGGDPERVADGLILLPTRRAARALAEAFLSQSAGRPLLLPRIAAFGALDEAPLALENGLDLPPAVGTLERLAVLTRLVMAAMGAERAPGRVDRAWGLAAELAALQDEAERAGVDLKAALPGAVPEEYAAHWQQTLAFLSIVTEVWPAWLAEQRLMNPVARQVALLSALARSWQAKPPPHPIWAAGSNGEIPAVAALMRVIAGLEQGLLVLPGLDRDMEDEHFMALAAGHPEHPDAGIARLLAALGARREDVGEFPALVGQVPGGRAALLRRALLPAPALRAWTTPVAEGSLDGLSMLAPTDQQEEAVAIALSLRSALEGAGARAALVTADRGLARRVAAELGRFGVVADDSAGEPLEATPPAVYLRLLAQAAAAHFAPVPLLALLKHPLFAAGMAPATARAAARALERSVLRGPGPAPGLAALGEAAARSRSGVELVRRLAAGAETLERTMRQATVAPQAALIALVEAAEKLAATEAEAGSARLWAFEEGEALAGRLTELIDALAHLSSMPPEGFPALLDAALEGVMVRSRRAVRGAGVGAREHPRIFIWGLLEARLQTADLIVLGGLTEGSWPSVPDPGPWLSRPMHAALGLPAPEEAVGRAAHDFLAATLAAAEAVFSAPRRREGAPAVPARWLVRLAAMLGHALPPHPAVGWARALDRPAGAPKPVHAPRPTPPVAARPRTLAVTEIGTWLADPYDIYARHILRLRKLARIGETADAADFGQIVHSGLARFFTALNGAWPTEAAEGLHNALLGALEEHHLPPHLVHWWQPRLRRIAAWVDAEERARRVGAAPPLIAIERGGEWQLPGPAGWFTLAGRADRIERRGDGTLGILDYKTGRIPIAADIRAGREPQLPLLAAMAERGAFGPEFAAPVGELTYWQLSGREAAGEAGELARPEQLPALKETAVAGLQGLIAAFDDPSRPYLAQPHPGNAPSFADYARLARVAEWTAGGE